MTGPDAPAAQDWAAEFDGAFRDAAPNVQRRVWRDVFGPEYPDGVTCYSYVSRSELRRFRHECRTGPGDLLGDYGCGQGGPGLWVARQSGSRLVGLDISTVALTQARVEAEALGLGDRAEFRPGGFGGSDLGDATLDAVLSVDALLFAIEKTAAVREVARVLRPGGRFVATTFDYRSQPLGRPPQVDDHRPLLDAAGFDLVDYAETDEWRQRCEGVADGLIAAVADLAAESGEDPVRLRAELDEMRATIGHMRRRVLIVAQRRPA